MVALKRLPILGKYLQRMAWLAICWRNLNPKQFLMSSFSAISRLAEQMSPLFWNLVNGQTYFVPLLYVFWAYLSLSLFLSPLYHPALTLSFLSPFSHSLLSLSLSLFLSLSLPLHKHALRSTPLLHFHSLSLVNIFSSPPSLSLFHLC